MNENEKLPVEKLLEQMPLKRPSQALADAVRELTERQSSMEVIPTPRASFGWRSLAATALICASVGILIGMWIPADQTPESTDPKSHLLATGDVSEDPASWLAGQPSRLSLRENVATPLHGYEAQIIDDGFFLQDGSQPSRIYRVLKSRREQRKQSLTVRETIVLPSREI